MRKSRPETRLVVNPGSVFGRLTVLQNIGPDKHRSWCSSCVCTCGRTVSVKNSALLSGDQVSCGCLRKERRYSHRASHTRLYRIWAGMVARCKYSKASGYKSYGAKGITVCDEWKVFTGFQSWALTNGYQDSLTIDRVNKYGNYESNNCRWITLEENISLGRRGEQAHYAKLTIGQVIEIRKLLFVGISGTIIAAKFNVSKSTISEIKLGKTWRRALEDVFENDVSAEGLPGAVLDLSMPKGAKKFMELAALEMEP